MTDWKKVTGTQPERPEEIDRTCKGQKNDCEHGKGSSSQQ